jgi:hypothetical protein
LKTITCNAAGTTCTDEHGNPVDPNSTLAEGDQVQIEGQIRGWESNGDGTGMSFVRNIPHETFNFTFTDTHTPPQGAFLEPAALRIFPVENPGWDVIGLEFVRGIESNDVRFQSHIRPRHAADAKYPQSPLNGRFYAPILSMSSSKDRFDAALGALFNRYTPAFFEPTPAGLALEFVLPAPVGTDLTNVPTNSWTVILSPLGGGNYVLWTTYPGHPILGR